MHRIDTPTAQVDKFGSGKNGFTRGNPQTGVPATALDDDYFDAIQEEIAGVVESTGVALDKSNRTQLLTALKKLFLRTGNNFSEIAAAGSAAVAAALANLGLSDVAHLPQLTGVIGTSRNAKMSVAAASATATFTADELIVQAVLGGRQYKLASFNKTINLATTGAGGMDTGTVPANGFVALYAIYNPTTQISALLAVNASSVVAPEVYGGSNMPAGYMASALVSVLPTSSSQLAPVIQQGRRVSIVGASILSGSGAPSSLAAITVSAVPLNTTLIRMSATVGITVMDTTGVLEVAANAALVASKRVSLGAAGTGGTLSTTSYMEMPVVDNSRNIYWRVQSANIAYGITAMGYEF
ncbi:hypothetical protein [Yersinia enterocolitica]|uniref:hypothetical protein n=1 Tax=Yersinia enterocolitica TaxID=630 RepID=UPI0003D90C5D|nr:hypothetical protein [Yersinia enterocolitica]CCQ39968.1 hypothetical protein YE5303_12621 [Yersinia enterocolitica (type O:5) str. YE53/03]CQD47190.1 tail fiber protein [Yersinia enterocolitica]